MTLADHIALFGCLLYFTPGVMAYMEGARSEKDMIQWIMGKPLEFLMALRLMPPSGLGFIMLSLAIGNSGWQG